MAIVRSKDCKTTHEGFDGYGERTLLDEASGSDYIKMGDLVFEPGSEIGRHRHQAQEAFVVTEGTGTVWLGEEEALLSVGDAMLVPSGVSHAFKNDSGRPWRMVWAYGGLDVGTEFE
jgi:quercetin dioxygenase-like cupin family protein